MKLKRIYFLYLICTLLGSQPFAAAQIAKTAFSRAAELHLPALAAVERQELEDERQLKYQFDNNNNNDKNSTKTNTDTKPELINNSSLGKIEMLRLCYNFFSNSIPQDTENAPSESIFDTDLFKDMEMFCGTEDNDRDMHLAKATDLTQTCFGKVYWQSMFTEDIKDIDSHINTVKQRQKIVKYLVENEKLFNEIEKLMSSIEKDTATFLWFKKRLSTFEKESLNYIYWKRYESWNNSEFMLQIASLWHLGPYLSNMPVALFTFVKTFIQTTSLSALIDPAIKISVPALRSAATLAIPTLIFLELLTFSLDFIDGFQSSKRVALNKEQCAKYTRGMANVIFGLDSISKLINENVTFKELFKNGDLIQKLNNQDPTAKQLNDLIEKLKSESTKKNASFFNLNNGRVLWCFKKLQTLHQELDQSFIALGELDAYMSIARLYKKCTTRTHAKVCFAEFKKADMPYVYAKASWYPILDLTLKPEEIVVNDTELGTDQTGHKMLLSGPSFAGKSVLLKGLMSSVIFSHVTGIAFADKFVITPFAMITSHLNVSDSATKGVSKYKAELVRIQRFLNGVKTLSKKQESNGYKPFCFAVLDELFSSTNPAEGEALAFSIMQSLAKSTHCMCLLATHFDKMTQLEELTNGHFKNYKVWVEEMPDGSMKRPRLIVQGISNQKVGIKLLHGVIDPDIINQAYIRMIKQGYSMDQLVGFNPKLIEELLQASNAATTTAPAPVAAKPDIV